MIDSVLLTIKDDKDKCLLKESIAGDIGCTHVYEETDIFRAVLMCEKLKPQMVILDSDLFRKELPYAAKYIRENHLTEIAVLFGKAADDGSDGEFDAYISKPLVQKRIMPTLVMAIAGKKKQKLLEEKRRALETELKSSKVADFVKYKIRETNNLDESELDGYLACLSRDSGKSTEELVRFVYKLYH